MTIPFECNACGKKLNINAEYAGKKVKCPGCGNVQVVEGPHPELEPLFDPISSQPAPAAPAFNPYTPTSFATDTLPNSKGIINRVPDVGSILTYAFEKWKQHILPLSLATFVMFLILFGINFASQFALGILQGMLGKQPQWIIPVISVLFSFFVLQVFQAFLQIGYIRILLNVLRGGSVEMSTLFQGGDQLLPMYLFSIVFGIALMFGLLLLIVPGIILILMFWPAYYLIVDRKMSVMDSVNNARAISNGNWLNIFLLGLIASLIVSVGMLACCVGIIPASALAGLLYGTAYLSMSGELDLDKALAAQRASA